MEAAFKIGEKVNYVDGTEMVPVVITKICEPDESSSEYRYIIKLSQKMTARAFEYELRRAKSCES